MLIDRNSIIILVVAVVLTVILTINFGCGSGGVWGKGVPVEGFDTKAGSSKGLKYTNEDVILPKSSQSFQKAFIPNITPTSVMLSGAGEESAENPVTFTPMTKVPLSLYNDL